MITTCRIAQQRPARMPAEPSRVAIIGAGFAGLAAAAVLERNGVEYVVYEGADRVGGRVYSIPYDAILYAYGTEGTRIRYYTPSPRRIAEDGFLQHGAEFINGENHEIFRIANEKMLTGKYVKDFDLYCSNTIYGIHGKKPDKSLVKYWLDFVGGIEKQFAKEAIMRSETSVAERFQELYEQWITQDELFEKNKATFDCLARFYLTYYEIEWASPANELALFNFALWNDGADESGSLTLKKKGYREILEGIKARVPQHRIKLNSVVTRVKYSEKGGTICLDDGDECHYDYVIVTCSLGFLKRNHDFFFHPMLDPQKSDAISRLGFGNMMKVFLEYTRQWWPQDTDAIAPLQSSSALADIFPVLQPLYWNRKILVAWVSGRGPGIISELSDEELVEGLTHHLREALGEPSIPLPVRVFRHSWISDPLIGGSYTYLTPESVKHVPDALLKMAEPVLIENKPVLCFAGEHTHETMYQTTIGAYESGEREALRIIRHLSKKH